MINMILMTYFNKKKKKLYYANLRFCYSERLWLSLRDDCSTLS